MKVKELNFQSEELNNDPQPGLLEFDGINWYFTDKAGRFMLNATGSTADHNSLSNLQGGAANQFYHLQLSDYNNVRNNMYLKTDIDTMIYSGHTHPYYSLTSHTHAQYLTGETDPVWVSERGDYYTMAQVDYLILQASLSGVSLANYYTSAQTDANFLSANTATWEIDTIGDGIRTKDHGNSAGGYAAISSGEKTIASGDYSFAQNKGGVSSGNYSTASGFYTIAGGVYSHAEGNQTRSDGESSHAEGSSNTTNAINSHISGFQNILTSDASGSTITAASGITGTQPYTLYCQNLNVAGLSNITVDLSSYWTSAQTISYGNSHWSGSTSGTTDLSAYYTSAQTNALYSLTSHTHAQYLTGETDPVWESEKGQYYTISQVYTKNQVDTGFLSANTAVFVSGSATGSIQTKTQANATGNYSFAGGKGGSIIRVGSGGISSFNFSEVTDSYGGSGCVGRDSAILGGYNNENISDRSVVLGGESNSLSTGATGSAIIATSGITGIAPYTLYTNNINMSGSLVGLVEYLSFQFTISTGVSYYLLNYAPYTMNVDAIYWNVDAGTATISLSGGSNGSVAIGNLTSINGNTVTQTNTATTNKSMSIGDKIKMMVDANSATIIYGTIKTTRI